MSSKAKSIWLTIAGVLVIMLLLNEVRFYGIYVANLNADNKVFDMNAFLYLRLGNWVSAICTLGIYSFLIKENPVYRLFEHILLGASTGFSAAIVTQEVFIEKCFVPISKGFRALTDNTVDGSPWDILLLIAVFVGLLWFFQFSKKYLWLSRIAMAVGIGAGSGLAFKWVANQLLPQVTESMHPLLAFDASGSVAWGLSIKWTVAFIATISVLAYFFFAFEQKNPAIKGSAKLGRWFLMIALGAFFGNTFMSRLSALIERFQFLVEDWIYYQA